MRILMWDVHGGYTDSLVAGTHDYLFLPRDLGSRRACRCSQLGGCVR